jgi:hypothetical protein
VRRHAVLDGESRAHAVADEAVILRAPLGLRVVVDAVGVRQQPETPHAARRAVERAQGLVEPAERAGGGPAQHDALAPRLVQYLVEPIRAPGAEHADDVAAADVDQVLRQEMGREIVLNPARALVAAKQRHVARLAGWREAAVETDDVVVRVARGGGQEADARAYSIRERQHVVVQQRAVSLHRETSAAKGHDLGNAGSHCSLCLGYSSTHGTATACPVSRLRPMDSRCRCARSTLDIRPYSRRRVSFLGVRDPYPSLA